MGNYKHAKAWATGEESVKYEERKVWSMESSTGFILLLTSQGMANR